MTAVFSRLYDRVMSWSKHRHAPWYLGALSFSESSFFPIPPDVMLAPMALAQPQRAWFFAALTTLTSVAGGVLGYVLGLLLIDLIEPWLHSLHWWEGYQTARAWFGRWGFWAVFLAGFSPIPYKLFTIAAGAVAMPLLPFIAASAIGRGGRFFLVAALMRWGGAKMEARLRQHVEVLGWATVAAAAVAYVVIKA